MKKFWPHALPAAACTALWILSPAANTHAAEAAASFPTKPITIVVHTGPGSSTDIFARELAMAAEPVFGKPVVVVNRPGGSGATQMALLKEAKPDGYTVGVNTASHLTAMRTNLKDVYKWQDFSWITLNQLDPYITVVAADSPYKTLSDLVEAGKKPGTTLKVGGFGTVGAAHNIAFNMLAEKADMPMTWVSYTGGPQAMTALLGKHIDVVNTNPGPALQFAEAGRVRVLGILDDQRASSLPDTPTYKEAGYDVNTSWKQIRGIFGPKDIPMDIQEKLAAGFFKAMEAPSFQKYMETSAQIAGDKKTVEYAAFVDEMDQVGYKWLQQLGVTQ
ncbi:tripartite tricarboxylate transporter substrate binding protein [Bordetella sp. 15P40C-2]|uniref:tripartite tricarboxylate transporter substrate binding protein n=1 Tax=Bordetella sp. 15P40C-2 TaxID=2572246 RepID=UPI00132B292B|nr:tripartite tricarboxylate transporter substrate binding protein [Bordetella sp. 15P40C-2]MVW72727.1 tripartite tricarboxylate transporter substrate binding protein [Bordetella sp. 15P40C-2]